MIMTIHLDDCESESCCLLIKWFKIIGLSNRRALLESVAVHDHGQPVQLVMGGGHHGLPVASLLQLAIANRYGQSMTERTSVGLNPGNIVAVRVAVELGQRLEERHQILYWQEPKGSQRDIQSSGDVALG